MKVETMEAKAAGSGRVLKKNHRQGKNKSGEDYEVHELEVGYFGGKIHLRVDQEKYEAVQEGQDITWEADLEERSFRLRLANVRVA